jgi:hypothetical protein
MVITSPKCSHIIVTEAMPITIVSSGFHSGVNLSERSWHYIVCWIVWHTLSKINNMLHQVERCLKVKISQSVMSGMLPQEEGRNVIWQGMCHIKLSDIWYEEQHLTVNVAKSKHESHVTTCRVTPDRSGLISVTGINILFVLQIFSKHMSPKSQPRMT